MDRERVIRRLVRKTYLRCLVLMALLTIVLTIIFGKMFIERELKGIREDNFQMGIVLRDRLKEDVLKSIDWMQAIKVIEGVMEIDRNAQFKEAIYKKLINTITIENKNTKEVFLLNLKKKSAYIRRNPSLTENEYSLNNGYEVNYKDENLRIEKNEVYIEHRANESTIIDAYIYAPIYIGKEQVAVIGTGYSGEKFFHSFRENYSAFFNLEGFSNLDDRKNEGKSVFYKFDNLPSVEEFKAQIPFDVMDDVRDALEKTYNNVYLDEVYGAESFVTIKITKKALFQMWQRIILIALLIFVPSSVYLWFFVDERVKKVKYTRELRVSNKKMEREIDDKKIIFSVIGHDLRSPFTSILGLIQLLERNIDKYEREKKLQVLNIIKESSEKLLEITTNLLNWSTIQSNKIRVNREEIDLKRLVDKYIKVEDQALKDKDIGIVIEGIDEATIVWSDRQLLETIFRNLFFNAIKFTEPKGKIYVRYKREDENEWVEVEDTGVGIDRKTLNNLRTGSELSTIGTIGEKGRGLGLYISKKFASINGGKLIMESEIEKGSVFTILLPRKGE